MISFIIPNYNKAATIEASLSSIFKQGVDKLEVILVDDCSSDDSLSVVRAKFPQIKIIRNRRRLGAAYSRNAGIQEARGEYLVFLDSDVCLRDGCVNSLLKEAAGSDILYPQILYQGRGRMYPVSAQDYKFLILSTAFMIRAESLKRHKLRFDDVYEIYFEDLDFFILCHPSGLKMRYVDSAIAEHLDTAGQTSDSAYRMNRYYLETRNITYSMLKFGFVERRRMPPFYRGPYFLLHWLFFAVFNLYWPAHHLSDAHTTDYFKKAKLYLGRHEKINAGSRVWVILLFLKALYWNLKRAGDTLRTARRVSEAF